MHSVFVCENQRLQGAIPSKVLVAAGAGETASSVMDRAVVQVVTHTDQEVCARLMQKYDLATLPVVDEQNRLQGIITHDDILDIIEEEAEEDMYRLVGVGDNKPLEHGAVERALKRLPWLSTTLIGMGLIGPLILHRWFEATLDEIVTLAFFIPAIMGLSGNTATQSATITVRGLATGEIGFPDIFWMIRRELAVAMIIAVVCAVAMMIFAYGVVALGFQADTAATVGISMFAGIIVAVLLGTGIPMVCHRAGVDPAVASGPFITTLIDVSTQVIYLSLATWLLLGKAA
jgi:magnesium transporter